MQGRAGLRQRPAQVLGDPFAEYLGRADAVQEFPQLSLQRAEEALVTLAEAVGRLGLGLRLLVRAAAPGDDLLLALDDLLLEGRLLPRP